MKYVNDTVRRRDRLMDEARALELLRTREFGVLSMVDTNGSGYGVPLNYVWDGDHCIYIHCAPEGHKLLALEKNPKVSFCIIGDVHLLPSSSRPNMRALSSEARPSFIWMRASVWKPCVYSWTSCRPISGLLGISTVRNLFIG